MMHNLKQIFACLIAGCLILTGCVANQNRSDHTDVTEPSSVESTMQQVTTGKVVEYRDSVILIVPNENGDRIVKKTGTTGTILFEAKSAVIDLHLSDDTLYAVYAKYLTDASDEIPNDVVRIDLLTGKVTEEPRDYEGLNDYFFYHFFWIGEDRFVRCTDEWEDEKISYEIFKCEENKLTPVLDKVKLSCVSETKLYYTESGRKTREIRVYDVDTKSETLLVNCDIDISGALSMGASNGKIFMDFPDKYLVKDIDTSEEYVISKERQDKQSPLLIGVCDETHFYYVDNDLIFSYDFDSKERSLLAEKSGIWFMCLIRDTLYCQAIEGAYPIKYAVCYLNLNDRVMHDRLFPMPEATAGGVSESEIEPAEAESVSLSDAAKEQLRWENLKDSWPLSVYLNDLGRPVEYGLVISPPSYTWYAVEK
jgi:hypothetical protein